MEDDRAARRAITLILKRQGFAVSEAGTVADAIRGLDENRPDWILLDLMLPDGDGVHVLRRIRANGLPSRVCIITGCSSELLNEARRAGAEHVFIKPLNVASLMSVLSASNGQA